MDRIAGMWMGPDGQDCHDGDGREEVGIGMSCDGDGQDGKNGLARMDRIIRIVMGWDGDGPGWTGLLGWGWAMLDRIAGMETGTDSLGCGWVGIGRDGDGRA